MRVGLRASSVRTVGLLLVLLALPSTALGFSKAFWGPPHDTGKNPFPIFQQLGVSIVEEDLDWSATAPVRPVDPTNPNDPAYRWPTELDHLIAAARDHHMRILLQVANTPGWANGGQPYNWAPDDARDYGDFMAAAARRYRHVHLWMVWGEPTRQQNFEPLTPAKPGTTLDAAQQVAPHNYAEMLDAAYGALKDVSKANLVIGGCTYSAGQIDTQQWIENLRLPNGQPPRMDIYAHNPFDWRFPRLGGRPTGGGQVQIPDLPRLAHWIDRYLGRPRHVRKPIPIFVSEWNEPTAPEQEFRWSLKPKTAATYTRDTLRILRHWKRIFGLGWIELYDSPPFENAGLLTVHGKKKPDFHAFANG
jgi:hypothetical protein